MRFFRVAEGARRPMQPATLMIPTGRLTAERGLWKSCQDRLSEVRPTAKLWVDERRMVSLLLNCFAAEIAPTSLNLPYLESASWESSHERLKQLGDAISYRHSAPDGVRAILLSGPNAPEVDGTQEFDVGHGQLGARIIDSAIAAYLRDRGMETEHTSFETTALTRAEVVRDVLGLYTGLAFKTRKPFRSEPHYFIVSVQWRVSTRFVQSLSHSALEEWCTGLPVLYKPTHEGLPEISEFRGRYLGQVVKRDSPGVAVVRCRDGAELRVPTADLYPEGSPEVIRRFEDRMGTTRSVWKRVQQLGLVLNSVGRRNVSVLRDRLDKVRYVLGGGQTEKLTIVFRGYQEASVSIGLGPISVGVESE